jgi:hypothetical protein
MAISCLRQVAQQEPKKINFPLVLQPVSSDCHER